MMSVFKETSSFRELQCVYTIKTYEYSKERRSVKESQSSSARLKESSFHCVRDISMPLKRETLSVKEAFPYYTLEFHLYAQTVGSVRPRDVVEGQEKDPLSAGTVWFPLAHNVITVFKLALHTPLSFL